METNPGTQIHVLDQPTKWDNNGRELRILEGLAALPLTRAPWGFSRGLCRASRWRIMGIANEDITTVLDWVNSHACEAEVHGSTIEWRNLGY